jgi:hypothetical protein
MTKFDQNPDDEVSFHMDFDTSCGTKKTHPFPEVPSVVSGASLYPRA